MRADGRVLDRRTGYGPATKPATLDAIGRSLGVTRERARQLFERAMAKMTRRGELRGMTPEDILHGLAMLGVMAEIAEADRWEGRCIASIYVEAPSVRCSNPLPCERHP